MNLTGKVHIIRSMFPSKPLIYFTEYFKEHQSFVTYEQNLRFNVCNLVNVNLFFLCLTFNKYVLDNKTIKIKHS